MAYAAFFAALVELMNDVCPHLEGSYTMRSDGSDAKNYCRFYRLDGARRSLYYGVAIRPEYLEAEIFIEMPDTRGERLFKELSTLAESLALGVRFHCEPANTMGWRIGVRRDRCEPVNGNSNLVWFATMISLLHLQFGPRLTAFEENLK